MKRLLLVISHFFAESKKPRSEAARPDAPPYASESGIISIADARRAGIFTDPGQSLIPAMSSTRGTGGQA